MSRRKFGTANIITFVPIPAYTRIKHTNICAGRKKLTSKSIRTRTKIAQFACYKCKRTDESTQLNGRNERRGKTVRRAVQHANTRSNNKNIREKKTARRGVERYVTFVNFFFIVTCKTSERLTDWLTTFTKYTKRARATRMIHKAFHFISFLLCFFLLTQSVCTIFFIFSFVVWLVWCSIFKFIPHFEYFCHNFGFLSSPHQRTTHTWKTAKHNSENIIQPKTS